MAGQCGRDVRARRITCVGFWASTLGNAHFGSDGVQVMLIRVAAHWVAEVVPTGAGS